MIYSWDKFLRTVSETDTNIQIMDNNGVITNTINPFAIINVMIHNNIVRISLKSGRFIDITFSTINESKMALPRVKQLIDKLQKRTPIYINNEIKNYVNSVNSQFYYQDNIPDGTGNSSIKTGSFWYDTEFGILYVYVLDSISGYNWVTPTGDAGMNGTSGTSGLMGSIGPQGDDGHSAYDVWLETGEIGSVNAFLQSLVGASGTSGSNGTSGTSGINGTSGTSGINGTSGTSGSNGTSGTSGINGTSGTSGSNGASGTSGSNGTSGTSGSNGTSGTSFSSPYVGSVQINGQLWTNLSTGGITSTSMTIDFNNSNIFSYTLGDNTSFTLTNMNAGGAYIVIVKQSSMLYLSTFNSVLWSGGTPSQTLTSDKYDVYTFIYDGVNIFGTYTQNY